VGARARAARGCVSLRLDIPRSVERSIHESQLGHIAIEAPTVAAPCHFNPLESPHLENPYPLYARARREVLVFFGPLFATWVVTRYADVHAILRDPRRFSSSYLFRTPVDSPPEVVAMLGRGTWKGCAMSPRV
jgi:cytochrome P450